MSPCHYSLSVLDLWSARSDCYHLFVLEKNAKQMDQLVICRPDISLKCRSLQSRVSCLMWSPVFIVGKTQFQFLNLTGFTGILGNRGLEILWCVAMFNHCGRRVVIFVLMLMTPRTYSYWAMCLSYVFRYDQVFSCFRVLPNVDLISLYLLFNRLTQ